MYNAIGYFFYQKYQIIYKFIIYKYMYKNCISSCKINLIIIDRSPKYLKVIFNFQLTTYYYWII
jgi:hypothetical protein